MFLKEKDSRIDNETWTSRCVPINEHKSPVYSENKEETQDEVSSTPLLALKHLFFNMPFVALVFLMMKHL